MAAAMGHDYHGVELRQEEVDRIDHRAEVLYLDDNINIVTGDSSNYPFEENEFDFCFSCPPYFDLEVYSDELDDLSNMGSYEQFMQVIEEILEGVYRGLKKGKMAVWVVGNFRDKKTGRLVHFNGDVVRAAANVGLTLWDELVFWGASAIAARRSGVFEANRKSVRVHEYVLIFKK